MFLFECKHNFCLFTPQLHLGVFARVQKSLRKFRDGPKNVIVVTTNRIFRLNTKLNYWVKMPIFRYDSINFTIPSIPVHPLPPISPPLSIVYLPQSWRSTCHQQTSLCLMVVGAFSGTPAANRRPSGAAGENRGRVYLGRQAFPLSPCQ